MGFITTENKTTRTSRPGIPVTQKLQSAEYNNLILMFNANWQAVLDLQSQVDNLPGSLPVIQVTGTFNITSKGVYILSGGTGGTLTIDDAISGDVIIRTIATGDFVLSGSINSNHLGAIYQGVPVTWFVWDSVSSEYTF